MASGTTKSYPLRHPPPPPLEHAGSRTSAEMMTSLPEQITDHSLSPAPGKQHHYYSNPIPQNMDLLSWGLSSAVPFTPYDQSLSNIKALSHSMNFSFNPNNNPNAGASLEILNAESYNYGGMGNSKNRSKRPQTEEGDKSLPFGMMTSPHGHSATSNAPNMSIEEQEGRQKKKARVEILSDEDEAAKKARGRPRIDTKDETAVDRRRTQIRNAQRAYRSRKETTISSLESKVQELRGNNEEMSNMFINLYEFAVGKGLLQREPEFGQHLISTTERFLSLAKSSTGNESSKDDEPIVESKGKRRRSKSQQQQTPNAESAVMPENPSTSPPGVVSAWGYDISHDASSAPGDIQPVVQNSSAFQQNISEMQRPTQAPTDHPSFFEMMNGQDMRQYRVDVPTMENFAQYFPQESLPLPESFASTERTFARRLHREACQKGYKLICAPNPPPKRFNDVFAFTLRYSSKAHIKSRLERTFFSTAKDSLHAWNEPFIHLGGSGTHYPMDESDKGNMPKFNTGLSMGPFREEVMSAREQFIEDDMKTFMQGADFEGQFFDPNDIENYLRSRGINIHGDMQYVSVDLDSLIPYAASEPQSMTTSSQTLSPRTPLSSGVSVSGQDILFNSGQEFFDQYNVEEAIPVSNSNVGSNRPLRFAEWDGIQYQMSSSKAQNPHNLSVNSVPINQQDDSISPAQNRRQRRVVALSVNTLLEILVSSVVCLGRAPAVRPSDVDAAIWAAVREAIV